MENTDIEVLVITDKSIITIEDLKKVEIEGGYVLLSDKITRKALRDHNKIMMKHAKVTRTPGETEGNMEFNFADLEDANDYMVLHMIDKVFMAGAEVKADQSFIDNLNSHDFDRIIKNCKQIKEVLEASKKA